MIQYFFSAPNPSNHFLEIKFSVDIHSSEELILQLPAWRPGRYELGNFAKNIKDFFVSNEAGTPLYAQKVTKDSWKVTTNNAKKIIVKYTYYSAELNAGSTFVDENQMYVNPVNCCLYIPERIDETCEIHLDIPENYILASGLKKTSTFVVQANNFHELADSPFIASPSIQHYSFQESGVLFHIWLNGMCKPNWKEIEKHFRAFASAQIKMFGNFPVPEYHFLFHILPYKTYHGVEHTNSTVVTLGPAYEVMDKDGLYYELLGVSSHELFHTWNVKLIRPSEMFPYDYSKENYSRMGYLYEGATTYYGDVFLLRSGCFNEQQYVKIFNQLLERHFSNNGRFNLSVADSSFDTWLDGYSKGIPDRKTSIYTEGALITFMLDIIIRRSTKNKKSFNDVMHSLYVDFACKNSPVTEETYKLTVEKHAQQNMNDFFQKYIYGTSDYEPVLASCVEYLGWELIKQNSPIFHEAYLGIKTIEIANYTQVSAVFPNSIADKAGVAVNDILLAVNNCNVQGNFDKWCKFFKEEKLIISLKREPGIIKNIEMYVGNEVYYNLYFIKNADKISNEQIENYRLWKM